MFSSHIQNRVMSHVNLNLTSLCTHGSLRLRRDLFLVVRDVYSLKFIMLDVLLSSNVFTYNIHIVFNIGTDLSDYVAQRSRGITCIIIICVHIVSTIFRYGSCTVIYIIHSHVRCRFPMLYSFLG